MPVNQRPYTIDEQVNYLTSMGMPLDEEQAKATLRKIGYFRLKPFWWDMKDNATGRFLPNASFELACERYYFDKELRMILFSAIELIEITLRAKMVNHFSNGANGLWYLDTNLFTDLNEHKETILTLKREFNRSKDPIVVSFINDPAIDWRKRRLDGDNPDAWFIFEYASFGTLSKIYANIKHQNPKRSAVANDLGLFKSAELSSWLQAITVMRNFIAHHSRLWNRTFATPPATPKRTRDPWVGRVRPERLKNTPYYTITAILYLCNAIEPDNRLARQLFKLFRRHPKIDIAKYGFVGDWRNEPIWKAAQPERGLKGWIRKLFK